MLPNWPYSEQKDGWEWKFSYFDDLLLIETTKVGILVDLAKISSRNAAKALHFDDRGVIAIGKLADIVLLDNTLHVVATYKEGKKVR